MHQSRGTVQLNLMIMKWNGAVKPNDYEVVRGGVDGMCMGWLVTLVLVIAATVPLISVGQAQVQEAQGSQPETCSLPEG
jgi:hypothetical protein